MLVRAVLEPLGCRIVEAASGADAWHAVRTEQPSVAIVDIGLGDIDGLRLAEMVRRSRALRSIRLVVLTGHSSAVAERAALDVGVDAFVAKPFSPLELRAVVERLLRGAQQAV